MLGVVVEVVAEVAGVEVRPEGQARSVRPRRGRREDPPRVRPSPELQRQPGPGARAAAPRRPRRGGRAPAAAGEAAGRWLGGGGGSSGSRSATGGGGRGPGEERAGLAPREAVVVGDGESVAADALAGAAARVRGEEQQQPAGGQVRDRPRGSKLGRAEEDPASARAAQAALWARCHGSQKAGRQGAVLFRPADEPARGERHSGGVAEPHALVAPHHPHLAPAAAA